jgi:hypothetical protein
MPLDSGIRFPGVVPTSAAMVAETIVLLELRPAALHVTAVVPSEDPLLALAVELPYQALGAPPGVLGTVDPPLDESTGDGGPPSPSGMIIPSIA